MLSGFYVMLFEIACLNHLINKIYVRKSNFDTNLYKASVLKVR